MKKIIICFPFILVISLFLVYYKTPLLNNRKSASIEVIAWMVSMMKNITELKAPEYYESVADYYYYEPDEEENAIAWYEKALEHGNSEPAMYLIIWNYNESWNQTRDWDKMLYYASKLTENNYIDYAYTMEIVSHFFDLGEYEKAVPLLELGTAQGHADSMAWLGIYYDKGWGVTKDKTKADALFTRLKASGQEPSWLEEYLESSEDNEV